MGMTAPVADQTAPAREPRRRRFVASLLYGRNVDRAAKTRARIGLAVLVFALGYAVIAARLVMFAAVPEVMGRGAPSDKMRWRLRGPTSSTATAKSWRPTC